MDLESVLDLFRAWPPVWVYLLLFATAFIEYVIPPMPGDTFVIAGSVLVSAFGWHFLPVLLVVTAGSVFGAWVDFHVGRWLVRSGKLDKFGPTGRSAIDGIVGQMRKYGPIYLAVNRFVPGIRSFFFVAAGIAGLTTGQVVMWSALSALAWNAWLVGLGYVLGANLDALERFLADYSAVVWSITGVVTVFFFWRAFRNRKKPPPPGVGP